MDIIKELQEEARKQYLDRLREIDTKTMYYRRAKILMLKLEKYFVGCDVGSYMHGWRPTVKLTLNKAYNIKKDVNMFLDENREFIDLLLDGSDMNAGDYQGSSYDLDMNTVRLDIYYGDSKCELVKIREEIVVKPVYEVVCN